MNTYDIVKDFGVPLATFVAGMAVENVRERRSRSRELANQRQADKPWFALIGNAVGSAGNGSRLQLELRNDGAPVTCNTFKATSAGYAITQWHPTSLTTGEVLRADVSVPQQRTGVVCDFELTVVDRSGASRKFAITVDVRPSPPRFIMSEVTA